MNKNVQLIRNVLINAVFFSEYKSLRTLEYYTEWKLEMINASRTKLGIKYIMIIIIISERLCTLKYMYTTYSFKTVSFELQNPKIKLRFR